MTKRTKAFIQLLKDTDNDYLCSVIFGCTNDCNGCALNSYEAFMGMIKELEEATKCTTTLN